MRRRNAKLITRWNVSPWKEIRNRIIRNIHDLAPNILLGLEDMPDYEGRVDLRGIKLDLTPMMFRGSIIEDLDLSGATLTDWELESATVSNCLFEGTFFGDYNDWGSIIRDVSFVGARLHDAGFGRHTAMYERCDFRHANLRGAVFSNGAFKDCDFSYARLDNVDFSACQFYRCRFAGKLKSVWFRGGYAYESVAKESEIVPPNRLEDCDFTEAYLHDVEFTNGCDLSRAKWPKDGEHLIFLHWSETLARAQVLVQAEGFSDEVLAELQDILNIYGDSIPEQLHWVLSRSSVYEIVGSESLGDQLFDILRQADWEVTTAIERGEQPPMYVPPEDDESRSSEESDEPSTKEIVRQIMKKPWVQKIIRKHQ